jgi:HK97 family phage major capsid protein
MLDEKVKKLDAAIDAKRADVAVLDKKFEETKAEIAKSDADVTDTDSPAFKAAEEAMAELGKAKDEVSALENRRESLWAMTKTNGDLPAAAREMVDAVKDVMGSRSPGAKIVAGDAYKALQESGVLAMESSRINPTYLGELLDKDTFIRGLEMGNIQAAVITTHEDGDNTVRPFMQPHDRGFIEPRERDLLLTQLITVLPITTDTIEYVLEESFTNSAAVVPEAETDAAIAGEVTAALGGRKPQSAINYTKETATIVTLAHWVAETKKAIADVPRLQAIIDKKLTRGLLDKVEDQIVDGDGSSDELRGILNTPGIQHQSSDSGPLVDNVLRAMTKLALANFDPTATGINPLDWEGIRLMRDESGGEGTGQYLFGPPSAAGATTMWGRPVVSGSQFIAEQPIVADWKAVELYVREGVQVMVSDSHMDFFIRNLVAVLAEMRLGLVLPEPAAVVEISEGS